MTDLTPKSQKIPIKNSPFSSATHLNSLNFSIFTQKYHELRNNKPNDQHGLIQKQWVKFTRNYLKIERNNILYNYFIAQKIHNSRKEILQRNFLSKWHERYIEKNNKYAPTKEEEEVNDKKEISERAVNPIENNINNTDNTAPSSPVSPRSKKIIHKQYSDKSTDTVEIPKPTFFERIKSANCKTITLSLIIAIIACAGTYFGFHFYFKHNKYDQLYHKHKYESTLPPHDQETDGDIVVDYNEVFPEDQDGDLSHLVKNIIKKVKNIKNRQNEMNQQVRHIEESLADENQKSDDQQTLTNNDDTDSSSNPGIKDVPQETNDTNSSTEYDSNNNISSQPPNNEQDK